MVQDTSPLYPEGAFPPMMVYVTAPADMPAGYTFDAELNGDKNRTFTVEVVRSFVRVFVHDVFVHDVQMSHHLTTFTCYY
jgi:hypothetical protein